MSLLTEVSKTVANAHYFTSPLSSEDEFPQIQNYVQLTPKINFNSPNTGNSARIVVSSDGAMIVAAYQLGITVQTQFQTFGYENDAWVLKSTITTSLANNAAISMCLSADNTLLAISDAVSNEVVVYRQTGSLPAIWGQLGPKLTGSAGFGVDMDINSDVQMLSVLSSTGIAFYAIGVSTLTLQGTLVIASQQTVRISNNFNTLVVGNAYNNSSVGRVQVYTRLPTAALTAWSVLQTLDPRSVSSSVVYAGTSLSLSYDGRTLAVGCPGDGLNAPNSVDTTGAVLIYKYVAATNQYVQGQKIIPLDYSPDSLGAINFGARLQLNFAGDALVVGGWYDQGTLGSTWVFVRNDRGLWIQNANKLRASDLTSATAGQGNGVAIARGNASVVVTSARMDEIGNVNAIVIFQ